MGQLMRGLGARYLRVLVVALLVASALPGYARAADVTYGTPTATSTFLQGIQFRQPIVLGTPVDRVELLLTFPGSTGQFAVEVQPPGTTGSTTLTYTWDATTDSSLVPNTPITARWRVRPVGAQEALPAGPPVTVLYADTRFAWQTATEGIVRVHWYQGDASFGRHALAIAKDAISTAEQALGVTETEPIDFFVYADANAFRQALGPSTGEFVVGRAVPEVRTLFGLVTGGDLNGSEIGITIAHELTHIVFDTATHNPYHEPPHWLNEGVAKYLSEGYGSSDRGLVSSAAADGTLYPLTSLASAFPTGDAVFLAYAEADAAVDSIVRTHGKDGLAKLVDSYAAGRTDDEAFQSALGMDATAFDAAWFGSIGATVPSAAGPSAAPVGPVPPGWGSGASVGSPGTSAPAASGASSVTPPGGAGSDATAAVAGIAVLALLLLVVLAVALRSRRRPVAAVPASWPDGGSIGPSSSTSAPGPDEAATPPPDAWGPPPRPSSADDPWRGPVPPVAATPVDPVEPAPPSPLAGGAWTPADGSDRLHARSWGEDDTPTAGEASHPPQP